MKHATNDEHNTSAETILGQQEIPNFEQLRLPQNFGDMLQGQRVLTTIPVRRPDRQVFIRVRPEPSYEFDTAVLVDREEATTYLVEPSLWTDLVQDIVLTHIYTGITRQGNLFLWPVRLPGADGKLDFWNQSAHEIARKAKTHWLRLVSNRQVGAYECFMPGGQYSEPEWPSYTFAEILQIAFKNRFIRDLSHPVVRRLRGES